MYLGTYIIFTDDTREKKIIIIQHTHTHHTRTRILCVSFITISPEIRVCRFPTVTSVKNNSGERGEAVCFTFNEENESRNGHLNPCARDSGSVK